MLIADTSSKYEVINTQNIMMGKKCVCTVLTDLTQFC